MQQLQDSFVAGSWITSFPHNQEPKKRKRKHNNKNKGQKKAKENQPQQRSLSVRIHIYKTCVTILILSPGKTLTISDPSLTTPTQVVSSGSTVSNIMAGVTQLI